MTKYMGPFPYLEGKNAYHKGQDINDNPYAKSQHWMKTKPHYATRWTTGYNDAENESDALNEQAMIQEEYNVWDELEKELYNSSFTSDQQDFLHRFMNEVR